MRYIISSRDGWESAMQNRFGKENSEHDLTDADVVDAIIKLGRAEIEIIDESHRSIRFQNDYD